MLITVSVGTSISVRAAVFIQPRSSCVVGIWNRASLCVTAASRPSGETFTSRSNPLPTGSASRLTTFFVARSITLTDADTATAVRRPIVEMMGDQEVLPVGRDGQRDRLARHGDRAPGRLAGARSRIVTRSSNRSQK